MKAISSLFLVKFRHTAFLQSILFVALLIPSADVAKAQMQVEHYQEAQQNSPSKPTFGGSIEGRVVAVQGTLFQILEGHLLLDVSKARIVSMTGQKLLPASISVGMRIQASISNVPNDSSTPLEAESVLVQLSNEGVLEGALQEVDFVSQTFTLLNQHILVNGNTVFSKLSGKPGSLKDLRTRQRVLVFVQVVGTDLLATQVFRLKKDMGATIR